MSNNYQGQGQGGPYDPPPAYFEGTGAGNNKGPPPNAWGPQPPPPPPGYYGPTGHPGPNYGNYGAVVLEPVSVPVTQVILVGGCPACRVGVLEEDFSCLGILCAILFFPLGILCCLALRDKRCSNCGATF